MIYYPNYCYDCHLNFFGRVCHLCGGKHVAEKWEKTRMSFLQIVTALILTGMILALIGIQL